MTGRIISLHGEAHDDANALLPWYATGRLDADDRARVEAHLTECPQCQADLATEKRLCAAVAALPAGDVPSADAGWEALSAQLKPRRPTLAARIADIRAQWQVSAGWLRLAAVAQLVLICGAVGWGLHRPTQSPVQPQYHTLSSGPVAVQGNAVLVFRPDITEAQMRATLRDAHARLVDGPTAADAYIVAIPATERDTTVKALRNSKTVVLAEPVDAGSGR